MHPQQNITDCYNKTAKEYAARFTDELSKKHLDRILLQSFASENKNKGKMIDLGCGPGQTTRFLFDHGITDIIGIDISPNMIAAAKQLHPGIPFETADMLNLHYPGQAFGSAIAFYSIVNFDYEHIKIAFKETSRILKPKGQLLFSFHIGDIVLHLDNFLDQPVNIDFHFLDTQKITQLLEETGFQVIDVIERQPYKDVEHPSERAYIWTES